LTQVEVAAVVGVSQNTISKWENDGARPSGAHLTRLLAVLDVDAADYAAQLHDDAIALAIERVAAAIDRIATNLERSA